MNAQAQGQAGGIVFPNFSAPVPGTYCARLHLEEVLRLTQDWDKARDIAPVFKLVSDALLYGYRLEKK